MIIIEIVEKPAEMTKRHNQQKKYNQKRKKQQRDTNEEKNKNTNNNFTVVDTKLCVCFPLFEI
jgi:hypothetical protein